MVLALALALSVYALVAVGALSAWRLVWLLFRGGRPVPVALAFLGMVIGFGVGWTLITFARLHR